MSGKLKQYTEQDKSGENRPGVVGSMFTHPVYHTVKPLWLHIDIGDLYSFSIVAHNEGISNIQ